MGLFDKLFRRKREEISEIKSHVLGNVPEDFEPPPFEPGVREPPSPTDIKPPLDNELIDVEKPGRELKPLTLEQEESIKESDMLEILDRLKFIESQLSAIKSQTETINERLKNLTMNIERRYR